MKKIFLEIEVPDRDTCFGKNHKCPYWRNAYWCNYFDKGIDRDKKHPECLSSKSALDCGHHPDAEMTEYNDGKPWCAACHQTPDEVNHL